MKRIISAFLTTILLFSCVATAMAASFPDTETHWANAAIEYMVGKKILNGYEDGTFRPDRTVTRAEFLKMLDETFGLSATTAISYTDVDSTQWYYSYVAKAAAQGYLLNYGSQLNPSGELSRQEAAALIARYLNLDPDNMADPTVYPDYSSIKTAYRDYVLQATAEGLFQGYGEDGSFRPDAALTRAQALTILSRAAGTIYNASATGTDAGAVAGNAVITQSGVTVSNAVISGRMIISEGVSGGTITLSGCSIGRLEIRGTAAVILENTDVETLVVDSAAGYTATVSLTSGSTVQTANLNSSADLTLASRTSVQSMTVGKDAKNSSVSGSGTLKKVEVLATGFTSARQPSAYTIADGLTAVFNGKTVSGDSTTAGNIGFSSVPQTKVASSVCYLSATPSVAGTLYYYYATSATAPTTTTFDTYYNAASIKSSYTVSANSTREASIGTTANVGTYPYVVVMLRNSSGAAYNPVVVANRASTGFSVTPTIMSSGSYHYVSYVPVSDGTIYYYYTTSPSTLSASEFSTAYNASTTAYKGTLSATASQSASSPTLSTSSVAAYRYIVLLMEDKDGVQYQPIVLSVDGTTGMGTAGLDAAKCSIFENKVNLSFTPSYSGTLQYYFSASSTAPTSAAFATQYAAAGTLAGSKTLTAGKAVSAVLASEETAYSYPYLVMQLTSGTTRYDPVVISASGLSLDLSGTGFSALPTVTSSNGYYYLSLNTSHSATVYYYLTNTPTVSSASVFTVNYESAVSNRLQTKTGGVLTTNGVGSSMLQTTLSSSNSSYHYMALMVAVSGTSSGSYWGWSSGTSTTATNYTPIVIPLPAAASVDTSAGSLFVSGPDYNVWMYTNHQINFTMSVSGTMYYLYTDENELSDVDNVIGQILFGGSSTNAYALSGYKSVTANVECQIPVDSSTGFPKYAALIFQDASGNVYDPVWLLSDGSNASGTGDTGFVTTPTVTSTSGSTPTIRYSTTSTGTLYYYFSYTSTAPSNYTAFLTNYNLYTNYGCRGTLSIGYGSASQQMTTTSSVSGYPYVVVMMQVSGTDISGGYRKPVVITVNGSSGSSSSMSSTAFSGTPYLNGNTLYFTPVMSGTLYYSFTTTNSVMDWMSPVSSLLGMMGSGSSGLLGGTTSLSYQMISQMIASSGSGSWQTVSTNSYYQYQQSVTINRTTTTGYLAVWMVSTDGTTMSQPVFISLTGSTMGGTTATGNGFLVKPTYNSSTGTISYYANITGFAVMKYFFSNETYVTSSTFTTSWNNADSSYRNSEFLSSSSTTGSTIPQMGSISVSTIAPYLYKYVWIQLQDVSTGATYEPVCVQIS